MKKYIAALLVATLSACVVAGCQGFGEASSAESIAPLDLKVGLSFDIDNLESVNDLKIKLENYSNGIHYEQSVTATKSVTLTNIVPGIYTIAVSGTAYDKNGAEYYVNGNIVNKALYKGVDAVTVHISGLKVSPLVFKEIYYAGSKGRYFRDQFYEIYNNSGEVHYLDGLYFAQLFPTTATRNLPVWHIDDGGKMCYAERIWKFPGKGRDYPLKPGESAVLSQFAVNHQQEIYDLLSPVDGSHSEFEFNMDNPRYPDQPAINMVHVFYNGKSDKGTVPQFLTPVFGGAFVLFEVPAGVVWDPVSAEWQNYVEGKPHSVKAKIPNEWVLDAVECVNGESYADAKRVSAVLDAGITWVGSTYCGLGVARKVMVENNDTLRRDNGALIFQDTNNSTDDFERGVIPVMHRYHSGVPSWNATY